MKVMFFTFLLPCQMCYQLYAPPEKDHHSKANSASRQVQRQMSDSAVMHSSIQPQDTKAECITECNLPTTSKLHSVVDLEKSQLLWQKQPCQLVESLCTERTGLLLPELSSHTKFLPVLPCNTHFAPSSFPKCSLATFMCIPPEGGPFQAKQATQDEISGSTVHSAYLCPCHYKN